MTPERVFRILWGPSLANSLDFTYPVVGSSPLHWRAPRPGSQLVMSGTTSVALITGRYYRLKVTAQYFAPAQNFGGAGLQAFIDWAADSNAFTLVPNLNIPALTMSGCYLEGPFDDLGGSISLEQDATQTLDLTILHPTQDLGLAWRGLWLEYAAGGSLTDPVAYTFSRASVGYEINNQGYLTQNPSGTLCDGHYPSPLGTGLQTTILQPSTTNKLSAPEDLTNAAWTKVQATTPSNNNTSPRQDSTATFLREDTTATAFHYCTQGFAIAVAGNKVGGTRFVRANGRTKLQWLIGKSDLSTFFSVIIDTVAGTVTPSVVGSGVVTFSNIAALSGGWYSVTMYGKVDGVTTALVDQNYLMSGSSTTYTGDGASGMLVWGCVATDNQIAGMYWGTGASRSPDVMSAPFTPVPQATWAYASLVAAHNSAVVWGANAPGVFALPASNANARLVLSFPTAGGQISLLHGTVSGNVTSVVTTSWNVGDLLEFLCLLYSDGSVQLLVAVNGVVSTGTRSAALAFAVAWNTTVLTFAGFSGGLTDTVSQPAKIKFGPLVTSGLGAVTTVPTARAA